MASVYYLCQDVRNVKQTIVQKYLSLSESDKRLYFAAVKIQSTWRGYILRQMIKRWNAAATTIQRVTRGWLVRWHLPEILAAHYYRLGVKHYNDKAAKIQALWKGYRQRKIFDFTEILRKRSQLHTVTQKMIGEMEELFRKNREQQKLEKENARVKEILWVLFDRHHLLRTRQQEGVLSVHGSEELSVLEQVLKKISYVEYMREMRKAMACEGKAKAAGSVVGERPKFKLTARLDERPYERMLMSEAEEVVKHLGKC